MHLVWILALPEALHSYWARCIVALRCWYHCALTDSHLYSNSHDAWVPADSSVQPLDHSQAKCVAVTHWWELTGSTWCIHLWVWEWRDFLDLECIFTNDVSRDGWYKLVSNWLARHYSSMNVFSPVFSQFSLFTLLMAPKKQNYCITNADDINIIGSSPRPT